MNPSHPLFLLTDPRDEQISPCLCYLLIVIYDTLVIRSERHELFRPPDAQIDFNVVIRHTFMNTYAYVKSSYCACS